jgi:hypothetical protein
MSKKLIYHKNYSVNVFIISVNLLFKLCKQWLLPIYMSIDTSYEQWQ